MNNLNLYKCPAYLFCNYELLKKSSPQIAKECEASAPTILNWLRKSNIKIKPYHKAMKRDKHKTTEKKIVELKIVELKKVKQEIAELNKAQEYRKAFMMEKELKGQIPCSFCDKPIKNHIGAPVMLINIAHNPNILYFCNKKCKLDYIFQKNKNT